MADYEPDPRRDGRTGVTRDAATSLIGSVVPAIVGVLGTLIAAQAALSDGISLLFWAWTAVGFLAITDFGLTRTTSALVSREGEAADAVLPAIWRRSGILGITLSLVAGLAILVSGSPPVLALLLPIPLITSLQLPLLGALEGLGHYRALAVNRLANATFGYLSPALLVLLLPSDLGIGAALLTMTIYRCVSLGFLFSRLHLRLRTVLKRTIAGRKSEGEPAESVLVWVGLSSLLGPTFLYADRVALAAMGIPGEVWIFYVAISEILMKTYVVPAAVVSVAFPWFVRNLQRQVKRVRVLVLRLLPLAVATVALLAVVFVMNLPVAALDALGIEPIYRTVAKTVLGILLIGTVINWSSQLQIAVLHAARSQRGVAVAQGALLLPFIGAMVAAAIWGDVVTVAIVWSSRIALLGIVLGLLSASRLKDAPAAPVD